MLLSANPTIAPTISQSGCLKQSKRCLNYYNRVISSMEGKLKRQELLKVISQMEIIEKLPNQLLEELCRIFKIEEANAPHGLLIQQFKNKMVDIFIQEADGYMDYLQLPKFRSLGPDFTEKMHQLFISVWNQHGEYRQRQQVNITKKEIQEITPSFDSPEKMEQFHLKLLQMYREASICPRNNRQYTKSYQEAKISPPHEINNFLFPNPSIAPLNNNMSAGMQNNMYSMFPFSQTPNYPKVEAQEDNPYILDNKPPAQTQPAANLYEIPRFTVQSHPPPQFFTNPPPDLLAILNRTHEKQEELPPKNIFGEPLESTMPSFINYEYVQCVCAGRQTIEDKSFFQCVTCGFSYHLSCLKIESNPTGGSICPLCILRKETIFCKVTYEPMKFNWHFNERGKELRVQMTEEESHEIYQARKKGLDCQIRFLKINGKSLKKDKKPLDGYTSCNGYLQKAAKHTEITLPELIEDRHQPISLEIVLRSQEDNSLEQSQPKLYLFAVFLISIKKVEDIVNEIFSSKNFVTRDYYNQFMNSEGRVQVSLHSENFTRGQIKYPVRGDQCHHPEVFDIKNFLQVVSQLKRDNDTELNCPICSVLCTYFNYDKEIHDAITNFSEYDDKKPEGISIEKNGEFYWIGDEEQRNGQEGQIDYEPMDEERDDDDLIS